MEAPDTFGLEGLTELGSRNGLDMRPTLLRVLTDLYVYRLGHTAAEERHFTELALRLLEAVNLPTRVAVARRLARYPSPPPLVLEWFARDLPEVAGELRLHPFLESVTPFDQATSHRTSTPHGEPDAANEDQPPSDACGDIDMAIASELNELFFAATANERRLILLNLHIVAPLAPDLVRIPRDRLVAHDLESAALSRNRGAFAQHLSHALRVPRQQAARIADDNLGEPVVVAAKALGIPREVLYRILMFVNPTVGHSVERVHSLAALFAEIALAAAEGMVAIWQALQQHESREARHRPLAWDDETRRRVRTEPGMRRSPSLPSGKARGVA